MVLSEQFGFNFHLGAYDALQKKYLKTLMFRICEETSGPMINQYTRKDQLS